MRRTSGKDAGILTVLFTADVHIANHSRLGGPLSEGVNRRCRQILETLEALKRQALEHDARIAVVGDVFDSPTPPPWIVEATRRALGLRDGTLTGPDRGPQCDLMVGNHDQASDAPNHHALASLGGIDGYARFGRAPVHMFAFRPQYTGPEYVRRCVGGMARSGNDEGIVCFHLGVSDETTPPWLVDAADSIPLDALARIVDPTGIDAVVVGNWHDHRHWKTPRGVDVWQTGALVPTGWANLSTFDTLDAQRDPYGQVVVWDDRKWWTLPLSGPRFVKSESPTDAEACIDRARSRSCPLYIRGVGDLDTVEAIGAHVRDLPGYGDEFWFEGVPAATVRNDPRTVEVAVSTEQTPDVERLVSDYVDAMKLPSEESGKVKTMVAKAISAVKG